MVEEMYLNEKVNVGVIGVGWFGELHAQIYASLPQVNLVGVSDIDYSRADKVAQNLGVCAFKSTDDLLSNKSIHAVSVCTSDINHLEPVIKACKAGKHILVEKPMAMTVNDCDRMIEAAQKTGVKLMPGHVLHFNSCFINAHEKIRNGEIGEVSHLYSHRSLTKSAAHRVANWGGYHSVLFHLAVHDIDVLSWLANDEIVEVYADYRAGVIESEGSQLSDVVLSLLRYKSGALAIMEHSWIHPDNYPILVEAETNITGKKGKIIIDLSGRGAVRYSNGGIHHFQESYWPVLSGELSSDLKNELEIFTKCIANNLPLPLTGFDGRRAIAVVIAIQASLQDHLPVKVDYLG